MMYQVVKPTRRNKVSSRKFAQLAFLALLLQVLILPARAPAQTSSEAAPSRRTVADDTDIPVASSTAALKNRPVKVGRFAKPPVIDGSLDEEGWKQAAVLKDFYQTEPGDNVKPPHSTEVRIGYDAKFLYIGIHASDQPGLVRSTVAKRDDLSGNDYVAVWLDTFNDQRRAYVLLFNHWVCRATAFSPKDRESISVSTWSCNLRAV